MSEETYRKLCETFAKRGGRYPGMDIPEFYELARALFTPEEAAITNAMPRGVSTAAAIAEAAGRSADEIGPLLEAMADKGLCNAFEKDGQRYYGAPPFVPGIFEYQFMKGTTTEKDRRLARLIHAYKKKVDSVIGAQKMTFPTSRVITVDKKIQAGNVVHTYEQVSNYIENYDPISVSTCFCRHEAELIDENDRCDAPNDVCMQFGAGAQFVIERGMGRRVSKEEAWEVLNRAEEAGLVHCSRNTQDIDYLCNCCSCHCMIIKSVLTQEKPALFLSSGFQPVFNPDACVACETCIDRCPGTALTMGEDDIPVADMDRCFGCGVCATGCPSEAISMERKFEAVEPPLNRKTLGAALRASRG